MRYYSVFLDYTRRETNSITMLEDFCEYVLDLRAGYGEFRFDPYEVVQTDRHCSLIVTFGFDDDVRLVTADFALFWRKGNVESFDRGEVI